MSVCSTVWVYRLMSTVTNRKHEGKRTDFFGKAILFALNVGLQCTTRPEALFTTLFGSSRQERFLPRERSEVGDDVTSLFYVFVLDFLIQVSDSPLVCIVFLAPKTLKAQSNLVHIAKRFSDM